MFSFTLEFFSKVENMRENLLFPVACRGRLFHTRYWRYRRFSKPYLEILVKQVKFYFRLFYTKYIRTRDVIVRLTLQNLLVCTIYLC